MGILVIILLTLVGAGYMALTILKKRGISTSLPQSGNEEDSCSGTTIPSFVSCPDCGTVLNEKSLLERSENIVVQNEDGTTHVEWDEKYKCSNCGLEFSIHVVGE